jgi:hypothetical protein
MTWHRRFAVAAVAIAALAVAACGKTDGTGGTPDPTSTGDSSIGGVSASADPSGDPDSTTTTGATGPVYPKDARSYGLELLKAFSRKDNARLVQLASASTVAGIKDSLNAMGAPNGTWTYYKCVGAEGAPAERTTCTYFNATGDQSDVTMINAQLGAPVAVYAEVLDRTQIPKDASFYVQTFVSAWGNSNYQRMAYLSNNTVANYFKGRPKITSVNIDPQMSEGSKIYIRISGTGSDLGKTEVVYIDTAKISQGKPGGITGYKTNP